MLQKNYMFEQLFGDRGPRTFSSRGMDQRTETDDGEMSINRSEGPAPTERVHPALAVTERAPQGGSLTPEPGFMPVGDEEPVDGDGLPVNVLAHDAQRDNPNSLHPLELVPYFNGDPLSQPSDWKERGSGVGRLPERINGDDEQAYEREGSADGDGPDTSDRQRALRQQLAWQRQAPSIRRDQIHGGGTTAHL